MPCGFLSKALSRGTLPQVFALATECALDKSRPVPAEEALDLWALAASLQVSVPCQTFQHPARLSTSIRLHSAALLGQPC